MMGESRGREENRVNVGMVMVEEKERVRQRWESQEGEEESRGNVG